MSRQFKGPKDESPPVYKCTVMWPAIHQMEHENPGMFAELGMVHYDTKETVTSEVIRSLQALSPESGIAQQADQGPKAGITMETDILFDKHLSVSDVNVTNTYYH